jgi:hypothetical protein|tara:strand:+ start:141 stop:596 length:456 start_codon:yes stop_codon:yes gene_type:complete
MKWILAPIDSHLEDIKTLFAKTEGHKHANNYSKWPLFQHTKFARMAWDSHLIYYSAGIERPEYNGSIRIMSRHTRDRQYNFGGLKADLARGLETLDVSTSHAISLGYKDIWVSREENGKLLDYFQHRSKYDWIITQEEIPLGGIQWVLRLA